MLHLRPDFKQHSNYSYAKKLCALTLTSRLTSVLRKLWIPSSLVGTLLSHLSLYSSRSIRWHYLQLVEVTHKLRRNEFQVVPQRYSSQPRPCALQPHIHPGQLVLQRLPLRLSCLERPPSSVLVYLQLQPWQLFFPARLVLKLDSFVGCRCVGKYPSCLRKPVLEIRACGHFSQTKHRMIQLPLYGKLYWHQVWRHCKIHLRSLRL